MFLLYTIFKLLHIKDDNYFCVHLILKFVKNNFVNLIVTK